MNRVSLFVLLVLVVMLACMALASSTSDNLARANEAQAAIEANRTAQLAVGGLAFSAATNTALVALLTLLIVGALSLAGYFAWRYERLQRVMNAPRSLEKIRVSPRNNLAFDDQQPAARLPSGAAIEQMVQLEMLRTLQDMRSGRNAAQGMLPTNTSPANEGDEIRWGG